MQAVSLILIKPLSLKWGLSFLCCEYMGASMECSPVSVLSCRRNIQWILLCLRRCFDSVLFWAKETEWQPFIRSPHAQPSILSLKEQFPPQNTQLNLFFINLTSFGAIWSVMLKVSKHLNLTFEDSSFWWTPNFLFSVFTENCSLTHAHQLQHLSLCGREELLTTRSYTFLCNLVEERRCLLSFPSVIFGHFEHHEPNLISFLLKWTSNLSKSLQNLDGFVLLWCPFNFYTFNFVFKSFHISVFPILSHFSQIFKMLSQNCSQVTVVITSTN